MNPAMEACHVGYAQRLVQLHEQMLVIYLIGINLEKILKNSLCMAHTNNVKLKQWGHNQRYIKYFDKKLKKLKNNSK